MEELKEKFNKNKKRNIIIIVVAAFVIIALATPSKENGNDVATASPTPAKTEEFKTDEVAEPTSEPTSEPTAEPTKKPKKISIGKRNALDAAEKYISYQAFSKKGLIEQLEYEGYTKKEAQYGADNCSANWKEQAAKKAESYLNYQNFSKQGLKEQLKFEGFTDSQVNYAIKKVYK